MIIDGTKLVSQHNGENVGISLDEINQILGAGSYDLGTLCMHSNINKWSRLKPFRSSVEGFNTVAEQITAMALVNYALFSNGYIPTSGNDLITWLQNYQDWTYQQPRGQSYNENYRLLDFDNYNHSALAPVALSGTRVFRYNNRNATYNIAILYTIAGGDDLSITEMTSLSNYYLGIVIYSGNLKYIITAANVISSGAMNITINNAAPFNIEKTWEFYVVCSSIAFTEITLLNNTGAISGNPSFLPAPFATIEQSKGTLVVYRPASSITITPSTLISSGSDDFIINVAANADGGLSEEFSFRITNVQMTDANGTWVNYTPLLLDVSTLYIAVNDRYSNIVKISNTNVPTLVLVSGRRLRIQGAVEAGGTGLTITITEIIVPNI